MMDYDERVSYDGEMVPLCDLENYQISEIIADFQEQLKKPVNSSHEKYLRDMIDHLDDELCERGVKVNYNQEGYYFDDGRDDY